MAMQKPLPFGSMSSSRTSPSARCSASVTASSASERRGGGRPSRWRSRAGERADQPVSSLNLHQLRFLELAKALAGQPEVLLLDEVMAASTRRSSPPRSRSCGTSETSSERRSWVEHVMSAVVQLAEQRDRPQLRQGPGRGRARGPCGTPGRRRISRAGRALLEVAGLAAGYLGERVIDGHRRRGSQREAVAIVGSNGAGKTTLFRAIAGLLPTMRAGRPRREGPRRRSTHRRSRAGIAYVPAERHLFPAMTLKTNLVLGAYPGRPDLRRWSSCTASSRGCRSAAASRNPERRRAADAGGRALMARPRLLMLDEPTTGLLPSIAQVAFEAFEGLKKQGNDAADRGAAGAARAVRGRPRLRAGERPHPAERPGGARPESGRPAART